MKRPRAFALALALAAAAVFAKAELLAPKGAKATITVEYTFESAGKTPPQKGSKDAREWRKKVSAKVTADLVADKPQELSQVKAMTSSQAAGMQEKQEKAQSAQEKMAPLQADIQKIMAKCGEDEACMQREIQKDGMANSDSATMNSARSAKKDVEAVGKTGPANYQLWKAVSQAGTYSLDEWEAVVDADPGCMEKPGAVCHSDLTRKGSGNLPAPPGGKSAPVGAMFEVDNAEKSMMLVLPTPMMPLPYTQVLKTDRPGQTSGTTSGYGGIPGDRKPITVALKGDSIAQSGTETQKVDGGTVTVRWQLAPAK